MDKSQWKISRGFVTGLLFCFLLWLIAMIFLPTLASTGKPTPKERAYRRCLDYARFVGYAATNNQFTLDVSRLADEKTPGAYQSGEFMRLMFSAEDLTKQGEDYLVKTNCNTAKTNHEIIVVCEKSFDYDKANTSFLNLFKRNYAHAVGYSDGSTGIISPTEFTNLDVRRFTSLSQMATNALAVYFGR